MRTPEAGFQVVDHTSELTLRLRAPDLAGLVEQATAGFVSLVPDDLAADDLTADDPHPERFELDAGDPAATIVAWLNELVFLGEAESWLPAAPRVEQAGDSGIRVRARRLSLSRPFVLVKAATLHQARIRELEGGLEIDVTLDI